MLVISGTFKIPLSEIQFSYVRSSGPGGQNVNKVNSKCELRWNPGASGAIPLWTRERVLARLAPRLTREGELILTSDVYRDQIRNREECLRKLRELLAEAIIPPKARKPTKPTRGSERRRRESKGRHAAKKSMRGRVRGD